MKYIVFEKPGSFPFVMLFTAPMEHRTAAKMAKSEGYEPVTAGFYDPGIGEVFGASSSLGLGSNPRDSEFVRVMIKNTLASCIRGLTADPNLVNA